jgi:DNA helicase-2/ATP-dependent DNA helicase PcrA
MRHQSQLNKTVVENWKLALFGNKQLEAEYAAVAQPLNLTPVITSVNPPLNADRVAFQKISQMAAEDNEQRHLIVAFFEKLGKVVSPNNEISRLIAESGLNLSFLPEIAHLSERLAPGRSAVSVYFDQAAIDFLNSLDDPQKKHAACKVMVYRYILVIAGPGVGKTEFIVHYAVYLVACNPDRSETIWLITFSRSGADTLRHGIARVCPESNKIQIGTIHSIAFRILREHATGWVKEAVSTRSGVIDEEMQYYMIARILKEAGLSTTIEPDDIIGQMNREFNDPQLASGNDQIRQVIAKYQETKQGDKKRIDFNDMIFHATNLLKDNAEARKRVNEKCKHLVLDEAQDTSSREYEFIRLLIGNETQVLFVGDDDQTLYRFKGACPEVLSRFVQDYGARLAFLETTFRSTPEIVQVYSALMRDFQGRIPKEVRSNKTSGPKPVVVLSENEQEEADTLAAITKTLLVQENLRPGQITFLTRTNDQAALLQKLLADRGVAAEYIATKSIMETIAVRYCIALLKLYWGVPFAEFVGLLPVLVQDYEVDSIAPALLDIDDIVSWHGILRTVAQRKHAWNTNHLQALAHMADAACALMPNEDDKNYDGKIFKSCRDLMRQIAHYRFDDRMNEELYTRLEQLERGVAYYTSRNQEMTIRQALDMLLESGDDSPDSVTVRTVHRAKAMGFEAVIVVGMEEGMFPHYKAIEDGSHEAVGDERRILYTALSRAKKYLYICSSERRIVNGKVRSGLEMSYFLQGLLELAKDNIDII